jgi:hypothetical protein
MADLANIQFRNLRGFFQRKTGEVMKLGDSCGEGVGLFETVHQHPNLDELQRLNARPLRCDQRLVKR